MPYRSHLRTAASLALLLAGSTTTALAHHGWSWTAQDQWFELSGTLSDIYVGQPHATLDIETQEGVWEVDLAPLSRTRQAGFDADAAQLGQEVTVIGRRASDPDMMAMKAVRVIVPSGTYDVYPARADAYDAAQ